MVVPVTAKVYGYASAVKQQLWDAGIFAEVDLSPETLPKKIRNAELAQWVSAARRRRDLRQSSV
jgi:threonyl-tRNA synthetase